MLKTLRENAPTFLKDAFYDLSVLLFSHLFYQVISYLLNH